MKPSRSAMDGSYFWPACASMAIMSAWSRPHTSYPSRAASMMLSSVGNSSSSVPSQISGSGGEPAGRGKGHPFATELLVDPAGLVSRDVDVARQGGDRLRAP